MRCLFFSLAALLVLNLSPASAGAGPLVQVQTFDDPDHHWVRGSGPILGSPTPVPLALGGPTDPFLLISASGGAGPQSRLSALNSNEWAGDYIAAGIEQLRMDVNNFGPSDLYLRLLFLEIGAASGPTSGAFSSDPIVLASGSGWQTIEFDVRPSALTPLAPLPVVSPHQTLSNTGELRIFHSESAFFQPGFNPPVAATLGVDNIAAARADAAFVPEPATWLLFSATLLAGLCHRHRETFCSKWPSPRY